MTMTAWKHLILSSWVTKVRDGLMDREQVAEVFMLDGQYIALEKKIAEDLPTRGFLWQNPWERLGLISMMIDKGLDV